MYRRFTKITMIIMLVIGTAIMWGAVGYYESVRNASTLGFLCKIIVGALLAAPMTYKLVTEDTSEN